MFYLNYLAISLSNMYISKHNSKGNIKTIIKNSRLLNFDIYNNNILINKKYITFEHIWPISFLESNVKHARNDFQGSEKCSYCKCYYRETS